MVSRTSDWRDELGRWLKPFLERRARSGCPLDLGEQASPSLMLCGVRIVFNWFR